MVKNNLFFLHNLFGFFLHISFGFLLACLQLTDLLHAIHIRMCPSRSLHAITCVTMANIMLIIFECFVQKKKSCFTILYNLVEIALRMFVQYN